MENIKRDFKEAMMHRRSYYNISNKSSISNDEIIEILREVLGNVPSAFNSQSARFVLLLGKDHARLWEIVKEILSKIVPVARFKATEDKINHSFASGYGTILFFEDEAVIAELQKQFSAYAETFPVWSMQSAGMHQFAVWTMLEDAGLGASLQHYNPLIDEAVKKEWNINASWKLIAQMPFGLPTANPDKIEKEDVNKRLLVINN